MNDRDYFAAAAIGALISLESDADVRGLANDAYLYADAMLAKRARPVHSSPVGASSTAVDDHGMPDREIAALSADACFDITTHPLPDIHSVNCRLQRFARDAIRLDRSRRDAKPSPTGPSSTAVDETQGETVADGITDQEMVRICMDSTNLLMQVGREHERLYAVIDGSIREAIAIDRGYRIIRRDAVPRFTAEEVAALVTCGRMTHPDGSHHVWVAGEHAGAYDGHDDAQTAATEIRNAIRRTLEAAP